MIKVGVVSLDVSHPKSFASEMEKYCMDLRYEYLCNLSFRGEEEKQWFINRFGLLGEVKNIEDMVDKVDVGFIQSCNWLKHLDQAMPFIKAGKPVFIDKPIIGTVADAKRLRELVNSGARIIGSSSVRHADEVQAFLSKPVAERGEVLSIFGTCGVDEFNYSIHIAELFNEIAGAKATSMRFNGESKTVDGNKIESYTIKYENGVIANYQTCIGIWQPFYITVMTSKGSYTFEVDCGKIYGALLREIYKYLTGKKHNLADTETLINCCLIMMCGKKSRDERGGGEVSLSELSESDGFDGDAFEVEYAKNASKIYKD